MSWKPEVHCDNTDGWVGNTLRFATKEEAEGNVYAFARRLVSCVVECNEPVNCRWVNGQLLDVEPRPFARVEGR
jgi:hypothetical protein